MLLLQEAKRGLPVAGKINVTPPEEKANDDETIVYANKAVRILCYWINSFFVYPKKKFWNV